MRLGALVKKLSDKKRVRVRMGFRPSGKPHIGTLNIATLGFIIGEELIKRGIKYSFSVFSSDMELRSGKHLRGLPLKYIKDNKGCHKSKAEHHKSELAVFLGQLYSFYSEQLGIQIDYDVVNISQLQRKGNFRKQLVNLIESELRYGNHVSDSVDTICPDCHRIEDAEYIKKGVMIGECNNHDDYRINILYNPEAELSLNFRLASAMKTTISKSDVHIIGRDHTFTEKDDEESNLKEIKDLTKKMRSLPLYFLGCFFYSRGGKLSKSKSDGGIISDLQKMYGEAYIGGLMNFFRVIAKADIPWMPLYKALKGIEIATDGNLTRLRKYLRA